MQICLIVAATRNGVIGRDNKMPWHLPEDLKYFKRVTMGKPVVMGRKTYESIGRPLPGRLNIVVSRQPGWCPADDLGRESVVVVSDLDAGLEVAKVEAAKVGVAEVMVIGGAQIYAACAEMADRVYLTEIDTTLEGDAFFSLGDARNWAEVSRESFNACEKNPYDYSFVVLDRV